MRCTKENLLEDENLQDLLCENVFIYPTDTIYGLGCDATNDVLVKKIREIKERDERPFSIIAPSKEWIREHCIIPDEGEEWLARLPGPFTLILKLKKPELAAVTTGIGTIGVRIPHNWFSAIVADLGFPVVTTSVNRSGEPHMTSLADLPPRIERQVALVIDDGPLLGRPSTIVRLDLDEVEIISR
ncbi:threonylcarbamoyl-AMP synthase [Candidatus Woesearchaeota archaeon]|nr:MAG: threonylcarbamoyl-AMP synthase [Candidatus Woesearchaeota archaeon]